MYYVRMSVRTVGQPATKYMYVKNKRLNVVV